MKERWSTQSVTLLRPETRSLCRPNKIYSLSSIYFMLNWKLRQDFACYKISLRSKSDSYRNQLRIFVIKIEETLLFPHTILWFVLTVPKQLAYLSSGCDYCWQHVPTIGLPCKITSIICFLQFIYSHQSSTNLKVEVYFSPNVIVNRTLCLRQLLDSLGHPRGDQGWAKCVTLGY